MSADAFEVALATAACLLVGGAVGVAAASLPTKLLTAEFQTFVSGFVGFVALCVASTGFAWSGEKLADATFFEVTELGCGVAFSGRARVGAVFDTWETNRDSLSYDEIVSHFFFAVKAAGAVGVLFTSDEAFCAIFEAL